MADPRILHCYAQVQWHDEAWLSGTPDALVMLRDAIDRALNEGAGQCDLFTGDGEGYTVHVVKMTEADALKQALPYTDEHLREPICGGFGPWSILMGEEVKEPSQ